MQAELPIDPGVAPSLAPGSIWRRRSWHPRRRVLETRLYVLIEVDAARVTGRWFDSGRRSSVRRDRFPRLARFVAARRDGGGELNAAAA